MSHSIGAGKPEGELSVWEQPKQPFEPLNIDHFGLPEQTLDGYKFILLAIDAFTCFIWLIPTKTPSSRESIGRLKLIFDYFGHFRRVVSDRGSIFYLPLRQVISNCF